MNNQFDYTPQTDGSAFETAPFTSSPQPAGHAKGFATAALWLGIASLFCTCCCCCLYFLSPVLSIVGIVMACLARRDNEKKMPTMAVVGLVLAIIGLVFFLFIIALEIGIMMMPETELEALFNEFFADSGMTYEDYKSYTQTVPME